MNRRPRIALIGALLLLGTLGGAMLHAADGYGHSPRQYYGNWHRHQSGHFYRTYYYKPHTNYAGYRHHYVVLFPNRPKHVYFYNPYTKRYWGRCPSLHGGKPDYQHLTLEDQKQTLSEIPESAFPESKGLPPLPESKDGAQLDLPPDDLPDEFQAQ